MSTTEAPSLFSSLPNDIVVNVVARVPRRYYPILACVSKKMRSLVRSSELDKTRSLMGKDCFYVCFEDRPCKTYHWFTLTENRCLVSIPFTCPPEPYSGVLMVGPEIYFVGNNHMWILDSRSGKLRQGPSSLVATKSAGVGLFDEKIYIFGGVQNNQIQAQVFDLKTQTWQVAPNPNVTANLSIRRASVVSPSLGRLIYAKTIYEARLSYDPRDGKVDWIFTPYDDHDFFFSNDLCVIDNVLYMYYSHVGLMWYNSKQKKWRVVCGLEELNGYFVHLSLAEYKGKLAFMFRKPTMELWCTMIALHGNGLEICGSVEWSDCLLSDLPPQFKILHYFGRTD